ncbi:MAG: hypothetical protein U0790_29145, partial [Isosphaeraceae bacterium]
FAQSGRGGDGGLGGPGGAARSGNGGNGGAGGSALGGAILNVNGGVLTIRPRLGAKRNSPQSRATNLITGNQANRGLPGAGGLAGNLQVGGGGTPGGAAGTAFPGTAGSTGPNGVGIGGGLNLFPGGTAAVSDTTITGNTATTADSDVSGTITP